LSRGQLNCDGSKLDGFVVKVNPSAILFADHRPASSPLSAPGDLLFGLGVAALSPTTGSCLVPYLFISTSLSLVSSSQPTPA